MSTEKWKTVGSKNKSNYKREPLPRSAKKTTGIEESSSVFSQYSTLQDGEGAGNAVQSSARETSVNGGSTLKGSRRETSGGNTNQSETASGVRKKTSSSKRGKGHMERLTFEECVRELDSNALADFIDEAQSKFSDNPQNLLKEISGYLETSFQRSEVEKDFTFSNNAPGFPLSCLPKSYQDPLLVVVGRCPPLAQESVFRYCVDRLLGEVRTGLPSYGMRIMLQLLIQSNPSTCSEATERIKLLLQSSISKVPEALSLLWVGLPHPELHPFAASVLGAWPELCLPLLYSSSNVPKQVVNYAVSYTCLLLRHVGASGGPELPRAVPPQILCAVLTSPQLVGKKNIGIVDELFQLIQDSLLECCSTDKLSTYFSATFKHLQENNSQMFLVFATNCLSKSSACFRAWERHFPRYPQPSVLLLQRLSRDLPRDISLRHLAQTLKVLVSRGTPEERELAQAILSAHAASFSKARSSDSDSLDLDGNSKQRRGNWCSLCGVLLLVSAVAYLYVLGLFLLDLASNGPDKYIDMLKVYVDAADVTVATDTMWRGLRGVVHLFNHYIISSMF